MAATCSHHLDQEVEPEQASISDPTGIRTRVFAVSGRCPWPLDDGAVPKGEVRF